MGEGLPFPVLLSTALGMNEMVIAGQHVEFIHVFYTWMSMLILAALGLAVRNRLELVPSGLQNGLEALIGCLEKFTIENMGEEEGKRFFPMLVVTFLFILTMNLLGLIPGCEAPTANLNTTAALALFVFVYYNYVGIRRWRGHYIQQFMGPLPALAPFMMIIEFVSHLSRPLSLTLRLFGNIQGEAMIMILFFMLAPLISTLPIYFLFLMGKMLQAFIFFMLTIIYIKSAVEGAH